MNINNLISFDKNPKLYIIFGPMGASKTTTSLLIASQYIYAGKHVLFFSSALDTRNNTNNKNINNKGISTHNQNITDDGIKNITIETFYNFDYKLVRNYDIIMIDEGQFFDDSIITFTKTLLNKGKMVYISGLDGDANKNIFGHVTKLIPYAYFVIKSRCLCQFCREDGNMVEAPYTARIKQSVNATTKDGVMIDIGDTQDMYKAACWKCHKKYNI
jgi:thymidine kinase